MVKKKREEGGEGKKAGGCGGGGWREEGKKNKEVGWCSALVVFHGVALCCYVGESSSRSRLFSAQKAWWHKFSKRKRAASHFHGAQRARGVLRL
jgi:hypothetical protein